MNPVSQKQNIYFGSLNNPVKPFVIKTTKGTLHFREYDYTKRTKNKFWEKLMGFFNDNFANTTSDPAWKDYNSPTFDKKSFNKEDAQNYMKLSDNPDATILVGRNRWRKIVAGIIAKPLDAKPVIEDNKTLYVDSIAIDPQYRGNKVGENLLNKTIESMGNRYSDCFLASYNESLSFYKKQGFRTLENTNPQEGKAIKKLSEWRNDNPHFVTFVTKPIDKSQLRWYDRI